MVDVHVIDHIGDVVGRNDFRNDGKTERVSRLFEDFYSLGTQSLKRIRTRARLICTAAEHNRPGLRNAAGNVEHLLAVFNRTGTGDAHKARAADADNLTAVVHDFDDGIFFFEFPARHFIRLGNRNDARNSV